MITVTMRFAPLVGWTGCSDTLHLRQYATWTRSAIKKSVLTVRFFNASYSQKRGHYRATLLSEGEEWLGLDSAALQIN